MKTIKKYSWQIICGLLIIAMWYVCNNEKTVVNTTDKQIIIDSLERVNDTLINEIDSLMMVEDSIVSIIDVQKKN